MPSAKINFDIEQWTFLCRCKDFGFADKSALVNRAIDEFKQKLACQRLIESAQLYVEVYDADEELRGLTATALEHWPE